jgi:hypothetical protein
VTIVFAILGVERGHIPGPVVGLRRMIEQGQAPLLVRFWGRWAPGDCELVATAAMLSLERAGEHGWQHLAGETRFGRHHWLESGPWALDLSNGREKPALVAPRAAYYGLISLRCPLPVAAPPTPASGRACGSSEVRVKG